MNKKYYKLIFLLFLTSFVATAQQSQNQWIWTNGSKIAEENTLEFGVTGEEDPTNFPTFARNGISLTDSEGITWFFTNGNNLWTYNPTTNNFNYKKGIYGGSVTYCKGLQIENYRNLPAASQEPSLWMDANDDIWYFSGYINGTGQNNKLWKYRKATNNWTLIDEGTVDSPGNFGTQGVESSTNKPPALMGGITWTGHNNTLWLFGGGMLMNGGSCNSLWKYNITTGNWTWVSGSSTAGQAASYGPLGVESSLSMPGTNITGCGSWSDAQGNLWLLEGKNIWKFNPVTSLWTWVKKNPNTSGLDSVATIGTENAANFPQTSSAFTNKGRALWKDQNDNLWYYNNNHNNDVLWKYNPLSNMWTLVKTIPNSSFDGMPIGQFNTADIGNSLGARITSITASGANGKLYLMGGTFYNETGNAFQDVWEYDPATNIWKWIKGFPFAQTTYETDQKIKFKGSLESENSPGFMEKYTAKWEYNGDMFIYGIIGVKNTFSGNYIGMSLLSNGTPISRGIWQYHSDLKKWEYVEGFEESAFFGLGAVYNTQGVESVNNYPGIKYGVGSWADNNGNLWLYGGTDTYATNTYYNSLWKFNRTTKLWVWVSGSNTSNQLGVYGTQGAYAPGNIPGARKDAKTWKDNDGNFWLFGGFGFDSASTTAGSLNDLWKYNVSLNQWMWVKGSNLKNQNEVSVGFGIADPTNTPTYSTISSTWNNVSGIFWLANQTNFWKFDTATNNWTKVANVLGTNYGTMGVPSPTNSPGTISGATWVDDNGNLLYFNSALWSYNTTNNIWTWIGGRRIYGFDTTYRYANYGQLDQAFISNFPGVRNNTATWKDTHGNLFLYGGNGWDEDSQGDMSDVWKSNRNFNLITGNVKVDINNNGCADSNVTVNNYKINVTDGTNSSFIYTNTAGSYGVLAQNNTVTIAPQQSYYTFTPASQNFNFTGFGATQMQDFCATATGIFNDLEITIIPLNNAAVGMDVKYKIIYKNIGTTVLSGNIQFNFDDAIMDYVSSTPAVASQTNGVLSWNYTNLNLFETRTILVTLNLNGPTENPALNTGDLLNYSAVINPALNDVTPANNTFNLVQPCIVSHDPNDKTCLEGTSVTTQQIGDYVHYMIRFENTGTANANNIVISDYIDTNKFDIETIVPIEASHAYTLTVTNNKLDFLMENINLPFPPSDLRYGYVVFKIKIKASLTLGDTFSNEASIYFDYNSPLVTNNYITAIDILGTSQNELTNPITFYPNPVKDRLFFKTDENVLKVEVYDIIGRIISSNPVNDNAVDLRDLKTGTYVMRIYTMNGISSGKIIKE